MIKKLLLLSLLCVSLISLFAQKSVVPLPVDSGYKYSGDYIFYALPQTAFKVNVTVTKSNEFQGIYGDYAKSLLGLTNVISSDRITYSVKNIEIETVEVPDTTCVYAVQLSSKQRKSDVYSNVLLQRSANGKGQGSCGYTPDELQIPDFFRYYSDLAYMEQNDNYVETQIVDGVVRQVPAVRTQKVAKSSQQKAQEAADQIGKIREDRYALLTGSSEVPYSAEAISKMVDELNTMEQNYISLFTGFVVEEEEHYTVWVLPAAGETQISLFSVSQTAGFNTRLSAKPAENYVMNLQPVKEASVRSAFDVKWHCSQGHKPYAGYRLRLPAAAQISINQGATPVFDLGTRYIYQWGTIDILPLGKDDFDISKIGFIY